MLRIPPMNPRELGVSVMAHRIQALNWMMSACVVVTPTSNHFGAIMRARLHTSAAECRAARYGFTLVNAEPV
jgi:hypothetical protein